LTSEPSPAGSGRPDADGSRDAVAPPDHQTERPAATRPFTVTIGIPTYHRPESLLETLDSLRPLATGHDHHESGASGAAPDEIGVIPPTPSRWQIDEVLVIDNDDHPTALLAVDGAVASGYPLPVRHVHETTPGLAAARNRALDEARSRILVFIDDDEVAEPGWPGGLIEVLAATGAGLVGGPVRTRFVREPPSWVTAGGFFDRAEPADGSAQTWLRSGNLAIDLEAVDRIGLRFDAAFGLTGGEDVAFSRSARQAGLELRWSATAAVEEKVGPERTTLRWITRRERASTTNWVRVERALDPSARRAALIMARGGVRLVQGAATAAAGSVTLDYGRRARGLVMVARGVGALRGLAARAPETYRTSNDTRS
jgi:GT2 family glycosyltransferase